MIQQITLRKKIVKTSNLKTEYRYNSVIACCRQVINELECVEVCLDDKTIFCSSSWEKAKKNKDWLEKWFKT